MCFWRLNYSSQKVGFLFCFWQGKKKSMQPWEDTGELTVEYFNLVFPNEPQYILLRKFKETKYMWDKM